MSSDLLREAAALMRERAEAATPGPWCVPDADDEYVGPADVVGDGEPGDRFIVCEHAGMDADHIASRHPVVALAVADWLDVAAELWGETYSEYQQKALTVARAYLGRDA